jgi:hypothetical protein
MWVNIIKMDLLEIGWGGVDWIGLAQNKNKWRAIMNAVMNSRVPNCLETNQWLHNWWSRVVLSSIKLLISFIDFPKTFLRDLRP